MDNENGVHIHCGILHKRRENWNYKIFMYMDGRIKDYIEWGYPDTEKQTLNAFSHLFPNRKSSEVHV